MSNIVPFPTDPTDPDPVAPTRARRAKSTRCARGIELQTAREAAGMTQEQVARRVILLARLRCHPDHGEELTGRDLKSYLPFLTREIARLERTSQHAYDRAAADRARPEYRARSWRPFPKYFDEPLAAIALGDVSMTFEELRATVTSQKRASDAEWVGLRRAELRRLGDQIACLVWNQADDPRFLDRALLEELQQPDDNGSVWLRGDTGFLVRAVLMGIARELRVCFPSRPLMDLDEWKDAA